MRKKGVMGNTNIVEKVVHVEDKAQMEELEKKLEEEKMAIRAKAQADKEAIEQQANIQKEEKEKILEEIQKREADQEKAKTK